MASRTNRRDQPLLRLRRMRTEGNWPEVVGRPEGWLSDDVGVFRNDIGSAHSLLSAKQDQLRPTGKACSSIWPQLFTLSVTVLCAVMGSLMATIGEKEKGEALIANAGQLALGHIDMKMISMGVIGLGP